ncbi:MAG TPA: ABC transporter substrate-binding protein [Tepidisphaeraceae bacterium]|nr:ABC transporter substrate-binding protein [Tepidisphaeraceae bacterium]
MENRFGFKDLVLAALVVLLIVVVCLGMYMIDRQQKILQTMQQDARVRTGLLRDMRNSLHEGIAFRDPAGSDSPTTQKTYPHGDPFGNLKAAERQPGFARGDWIIDNFGTKLAKVNYPIAGDLYAYWVESRILEGLIYRDPETLEYRPQLARDWQVSEDGMTYTFQLRKGVRFSDGSPFTADDVLFSYQLIMNPKINAPRLRAYLQKVKSVEKKGDDEVVFTMTTPYYESLDLCGTLSIVSKQFYSKFSDEEINTNPGLLMGTGPYRLPDPKSWRPGQRMEMVRNDLYWGEQPTFDRCIFLEVEDETAEETMFGNGEMDVYATPPAQYQRLLKDPNTSKHANHYEVESPMNGYAFVAWNEKRQGKGTLFTDARVRRAMTMLTDRNRICHDVFLDYAKPISGPFASSSPQADPNIKPLPYDVAAAKKLLGEAGFKDRDGSGVLKDASGKPFSFRLTYATGNATMERVILFMKDSYARAGVTMELDPVDWPNLQKKIDERDFDAITLAWGGALESDLYQEFDSSQIADQGDDFMSYANPKLDAAVETARKTVDVPKRMALWHEAHRILAEDQPYTFLFSRMSLRFMDKRIQNVKPSKVGLNYVYLYSMPNPWYVPLAMQKYKRP